MGQHFGKKTLADNAGKPAEKFSETTHVCNRCGQKSIKRRLLSRFDPYQIFEVEHRPCLILKVTVLAGRNITKGWSDYVDTPDPYIKIYIRTAPEGRKQTTVKDNEVNPEWNESFTFLLGEAVENIMEIRLMEANYTYDELVGKVFFDIAELRRNHVEKRTFVFNEVSEIDIEMKLSLDKDPTLRYSLCLCDQEKEYLLKRKEKVMEGMQRLLGEEKAPKNVDDAPTIAVIGSGGGFRAMVGLSGVVKALHDSGILQCTTYLCGLSGSSWYISTLYSHPSWPQMAPGAMQDELKNNIDSSLLWLLSPQGVYRYLDKIMKKRQMGQPVSFTDFFGHMVGETLLKGRLDCKLSDQQAKLADGGIPMPLLTCVHVKKDRSARSFQEWVEFSPYEIGLAKYGTFMSTKLFGGKFFMGKLCKEYEEPPLHFLQGIWGSAFCILFKRLLEDNRKLDPVEMIRLEMEKQLEENEQDESSDSSDEGEFDDAEEIAPNNRPSMIKLSKADTLPNREIPQSKASPSLSERSLASNGKSQTLPNNFRAPKRLMSTRRTKQKGYWSDFLKGVFENKKFELLSTRAGRAGVIHNFMRGLSLQQSYPLSPFTPLKKTAPDLDDVDGDPNSRTSDDFDGIFEMHPTNVKHLYMVDAGLTFNSPYPVVLRPQREVDIILSFDFSARPSDTTPPFKELLLAANWAKKHKVSFPPIDTSVFDREGLKEMYIFKHPTDPHCPVVLHFCLVNIEFRKFVKPGVRRRTKEEKEFADFDIFDDPTTPYSTFNFKYSHLAFERLSKLTEFNTLLNVEQIKTAIAQVVEKKRAEPPRCLCSLEEVPLLRRVSQKNKKRLSRFLSRIRSGRYSVSDARKGIDKSIEEENITFTEEPKNGTVNRNESNAQPSFRRQQAISRKNQKQFGSGALSVATEVSTEQEIESETEKREIPGRRKPLQPEKARQWQDNRCFSIDDDDESQFYTAAQTPSPR
ncbi:cytosolic phospholipase A2-like isoform X2 [Ruditapes philippinarum]|uniref:cytosolic phospholipase A2-like isoform X2 n=1 Tax=Ruditapes philippinarum TaxID=129788 RepID=UPI00295AE7A2|nr:cytosolic phospholipase A2-like isoform X2 [Ruditapes philippinarum]